MYVYVYIFLFLCFTEVEYLRMKKSNRNVLYKILIFLLPGLRLLTEFPL